MDSASKETIRVGQITIDFVIEADDSGGSVTVFECGVPTEAKVPVPHSNDGFEETPRDRNPGRVRAGLLPRDRRSSDRRRSGPPDLAALTNAMRRHGLTPAQPTAPAS